MKAERPKFKEIAGKKLLSFLLTVLLAGCAGYSQLHKSARRGDLANVRTLLEEGAAVDSVARNGTTPLHTSALAGQEAIAALLLDQGAAVE